MLAPVLEIYVVWHPQDQEGQTIAREIVEHFHGTPFTGLIGGAVEVFVRSQGWEANAGSPRPIPYPGQLGKAGSTDAQYVAVVPVLGNAMAAAIEQDEGGWRGYVKQMVDARGDGTQSVGIFSCGLHGAATNGTELGKLLGPYQRLNSTGTEDDPRSLQLCRDLAQAITQFLSGMTQLTVFLSHTKHAGHADAADVPGLIALVRDIISKTHLKTFFDASDIQPGTEWEAELRAKASTSAMLALRTDLYPTREWCQREIVLAKRAGLPVVMVDAMGFREERGSFLMDHVPRVPIRYENGQWSRRDVYRALDLLVDECLKRALWARQKELASGSIGVDVAWWAPHAPEPLTLADWLLMCSPKLGARKKKTKKLRVLHPDPALGPDERDVLNQIMSLAGWGGGLDVMTPRQLASRGGG